MIVDTKANGNPVCLTKSLNISRIIQEKINPSSKCCSLNEMLLEIRFKSHIKKEARKTQVMMIKRIRCGMVCMISRIYCYISKTSFLSLCGFCVFCLF